MTSLYDWAIDHPIAVGLVLLGVWWVLAPVARRWAERRGGWR